ncbi:MAG: sigma 54-interacting transcriptional regulator, partial [Angelakisella sp.]
MVKVLLIIPYQEVKAQFEKRIQEVNEPDIQIETTHIFGTTDDLIRQCSHDIVIARGITYRAIREALPQVHLVEISMTGFDVANAIAECRRRFSPRRIAILAHDPALGNVKQIEELCGTPIEPYDVLNEQDIEEAIETARSHGADAFIGGLTMCQNCDALHLNRIHIKTGEAAIERAITEAVMAAKTLNLERAKTKLMQAVLNSSRDMLIAVNKQGIITAINNQAYHGYKLSLSEDMVGHHISEFHTATNWQETLATGGESDVLHDYDGKPHLVNCKPIIVDRQNAGVLITIQNVEDISKTEGKIRKELSAKGLVAKYYFSNIIGGSAVMRNSIATAYKYSQVDGSVLLIGETGTGKELFAHSIHNASRRSNQPFVAVNCAALPENLLESELFGYVDGAFSGAAKGGKTGLFELAHKGSIFLDEIGEVPIALQAKLLRVLQEKEIRRIGDDRVLPIDVRVISATNINIRER